jgi:hypothetical protein
VTHLKARLFAVVLILGASALIYWNWHQLNTEGKYSLKLAAFAPLCVVGGLFLLFFPTRAGKPDTNVRQNYRPDRVRYWVVGGIGKLVLMDPASLGSDVRYGSKSTC